MQYKKNNFESHEFIRVLIYLCEIKLGEISHVHQVKTQAQEISFDYIFLFNLSCKDSLFTFKHD